MIYKMGKNKKILKLVTSAQRKFGIAGFIFIYVSDHLELTWKKNLKILSPINFAMYGVITENPNNKILSDFCFINSKWSETFKKYETSDSEFSLVASHQFQYF